jgi:hypothetical protein
MEACRRAAEQIMTAKAPLNFGKVIYIRIVVLCTVDDLKS